MKLGAIEAGGTKFVVAVGNEKGEILKRDSFPTTNPQETLANVFRFFDGENITALGIGCFGPIDLDLKSKTYGYITSTPKSGWEYYNIVGEIQKHYHDIKIGFDTDVNCAALGEAYFGNARGLDNILYLTIGTGVGGGAIVEGKLLHGMLHPEMGHMNLQKRNDDFYSGKCSYHKTCFEGLAAGPAIEERWGIKGADLPADHPAWDLEAWYIAQALATYITVLSPEKIVLGGGVMHQKQLFPLIHRYVQERLNNYVQKDEIITEKIKEYIVSPGLGDNAGIVGALVLAKQCINF